MMSTLTTLFVPLTLFAFGFVLWAMLALPTRIPPGPATAGSRLPVKPKTPGLSAWPWEVRAVDELLKKMAFANQRAVSLHELTATVNRLLVASGVADSHRLPMDASVAELEYAVSLIENQLDLSRLTD